MNSKPADTTYYLNQGSVQTLPLDLTQVNNCQLPFTYGGESYKKDGIFTTKPTWLTWDLATRTYSYDITAPAEVGVYEISITAYTA